MKPPFPTQVGAARRTGASHVYVVAGRPATLEVCQEVFGDDDDGVCCTLFVAEDGVSAVSTPRWEATRTQDDGGDMRVAVNVRDAYDGATVAFDDATIPREDLAEVVLQFALRLPRSADDGAPPGRVVKYGPGDPKLLVTRKNENYFGVDGEVASLNWDAAFRPFRDKADAPPQPTGTF